MNTIWIEVDGRKKEVTKKHYIEAKTKQLYEFGYTSLTIEATAAALEKALAGKADDVISMFIDSDLMKD